MYVLSSAYSVVASAAPAAVPNPQTEAADTAKTIQIHFLLPDIAHNLLKKSGNCPFPGRYAKHFKSGVLNKCLFTVDHTSRHLTAQAQKAKAKGRQRPVISTRSHRRHYNPDTRYS